MEQYNVTGMSCAACSARVEKAVSKVEGVTSCSVSLLTNSMGVEGTASPADIIKAVTDAGYGASVKGDGSKKTVSASEKLKAEEGYEFRYLARTQQPPKPKLPEGEAVTVPVIVDTVVTRDVLGVDTEDKEQSPIEAEVPVLAEIPTDTVRLIVEREDLPVEEEPVYIPITEVPEMPQFPGGEKELMRFLDNEIAYTAQHISRHIEGEAEVAFIVDKTGKVCEARLLRKVQPELDRSILQAVEKLPQWKPGRVGGRPSDVRIRIPVHFKAR